MHVEERAACHVSYTTQAFVIVSLLLLALVTAQLLNRAGIFCPATAGFLLVFTLRCRYSQLQIAAMPQQLTADVPKHIAYIVADDSGIAPEGIMGGSQSPSPISGAEHRGLQRSETVPLSH